MRLHARFVRLFFYVYNVVADTTNSALNQNALARAFTIRFACQRRARYTTTYDDDRTTHT